MSEITTVQSSIVPFNPSLRSEISRWCDENVLTNSSATELKIKIMCRKNIVPRVTIQTTQTPTGFHEVKREVTHEMTVLKLNLDLTKVKEGMSFEEADIFEEEASEVAEFAKDALSRVELQISINAFDTNKKPLISQTWQIAATPPHLLQ